MLEAKGFFTEALERAGDDHSAMLCGAWTKARSLVEGKATLPGTSSPPNVMLKHSVSPEPTSPSPI